MRVSLHDISTTMAVSVGVGVVVVLGSGLGLEYDALCRAVLCCWLYAPLRAIEADVRNAPDIVDLNMRYPVEVLGGNRKRSGEETRWLQSKARDAAEETLRPAVRALRIEVR